MTIGVSMTMGSTAADRVTAPSYWHQGLGYAVAVVTIGELTLQGKPDDFRALATTFLAAADKAEAIAYQHKLDTAEGR